MTDERWDTVLRQRLPTVVRALSSRLLRVELYAKELLTREELEDITRMTEMEAAELLLIHILPRKGRQAYDTFVSVLLNTKGQEYIGDGLTCNEKGIGE